ncbi:MAG: helix-turn-helix domain-containing protein [Methylotenera sp.]|nr:helix-turn-helix domain-containing protein [Methylotenera sp.]
MSPFADYLHGLRMRHGIRQVELAEIIGYEQTYLSSLELGKKGPPTKEFINKLIKQFNLSSSEQDLLLKAVEASERKTVIDTDVHQDVYWMMHDLRIRLPELTTIQIQLIRIALGLKDSLNEFPKVSVRQLKRRRKEETPM